MHRETEYDETMTETDAVLANLLPASTSAERRRFLIARRENLEKAHKMLQDHLIWRSQYLEQNVLPKERNFHHSKQKNEFSDNSNLSPVSLHSFETQEQNKEYMKIELDSLSKPCLPQFLTLNQGPPFAKDQTRLLLMLPAMLDPQLATAEEYSLYTAKYFDSSLDRNTTEKVTIVIDVRGGEGWPNASPVKFIQFARCVSKMMSDHFPERLKKCIVFPIPRYSLWIWEVVNKFLDPDTRNKIVLIAGAGDQESPVPHSILEHIEPAVSDILESTRCADRKSVV